MQILKEKIIREGKNLGRGILKVDSFINHQVDTGLMMEIGRTLAARFRSHAPTRVLTAEVSGIAPAIMTAFNLQIPVVFARKSRPITMPDSIYLRQAPSHTKGLMVDLMVSPEVLGPHDKVLIVDDFLASGKTLHALARIVQDSTSIIAGFGVVIEKSFEEGREVLSEFGAPIEALVTIEEMRDGEFIFKD
jgi:xanthine phosphoribosyltransferase